MKKTKVAGLAKKIMALAKGAAGKKAAEKAAIAKIAALIGDAAGAETKAALADLGKQVRAVVDKATPKTARSVKPKAAKPAAKPASVKAPRTPRIGKNGKKPAVEQAPAMTPA